MTVEALTVDWLNVQSDVVAEGLEAFLDVPEDRPARFVTVERTGGPEGLFTGTPMLAVQVWAESRYEASRLSVVVAGVLRRLVLLPWVGRVTVVSVHNFPDPDSRQSRGQVAVELVTKFD